MKGILKNGFRILSLPLVLQLGQCHNKNQEHHFLSIEFKVVRKKAHHNEELCLNLLLFLYIDCIQNVDSTARKIEMKDGELKITLKL